MARMASMKTEAETTEAVRKIVFREQARLGEKLDYEEIISAFLALEKAHPGELTKILKNRNR